MMTSTCRNPVPTHRNACGSFFSHPFSSSFVVIDDFEVCVDYLIIALTRSRAFRIRTRSASVGLRRSLFVQFGTDTLEPILQVVCRPLNRFYIVSIELFPDVLYGVFDRLLLVGRKPLSKITQLFFALIGKAIGVVACLCRFSRLPIDGVVRAPSEFSRTTGSPPSITAIQELVVPRSIPRILGVSKGFSGFLWFPIFFGNLCLSIGQVVSSSIDD